MISLRIASRFGGEAQEIVLRSGGASEGASRSQQEDASGSTNVSDDTATSLPGPSNSSGLVAAISNVAQLIAAGK